MQKAGSLVLTDTASTNLNGEEPIKRDDIVSIDGDFSRGDVLHIYDSEGIERARGLTDFSSEESRILINNLDIPAETLLGYKSDAELIRPDNMVLLETRHLLWDAPESVMGDQG